MTIERTQEGDTVKLVIAGRLDTITQAQLAGELEKIFDSNKVNLLFDLSHLSYISSAGLRILLTAQKKVNSLGTEMKLVGTVPEVREIFEVTGFAGIMNIE